MSSKPVVLPKIQAGLLNKSAGLYGSAILAILADRYLKGERDPVSIGDLARATASDQETIRESLVTLQENGFVDNPGKSWEEVGDFNVELMCFRVIANQGTLGAMDAPQSRMESNIDEFTYQGDTYRGHVRAVRLDENDEESPVKEWLLSIIKNPGDGAEPLVDDKSFDSSIEAWEWFDEWRLEYKEEEPENGSDTSEEDEAG